VVFSGAKESEGAEEVNSAMILALQKEPSLLLIEKEKNAEAYSGASGGCYGLQGP